MRHDNSRVIAAVGVVVAAIAAGALVMPAAGRLGSVSGSVTAAAIVGIPVVVVLAATGAGHYGMVASCVVAVAIAVITCVVSWVVAAFAFATALSGSTTGLVLAVVLFVVPALCVLALGLLALRIIPSAAPRHEVQHQ
jgi:hypothetical protein